MPTNIDAIVITVSDTRTQENDVSGARLVVCLQDFGVKNVIRIIATDDLVELVEILKKSSEEFDLVMTTGGTGFSSRDNTPEATRLVIDKEAPGLAELMRSETSKNTVLSWASRGVCGIRGSCLIINLPGSPRAVTECFQALKPVLTHALEVIQGNTKHEH